MTLSVAATAVAAVATVGYFMANSGAVAMSVSLPKGVTSSGRTMSWSSFSAPTVAYAPLSGSSQSQTQTVHGYTLGEVTFATGYTPHVDFSWTDPKGAGHTVSCSNNSCQGWLEFGLYEPIYQGECYVNEVSDGGPESVTIKDPTLSTEEFCAELDESTTGYPVVDDSAPFKGEISVTGFGLSGWLSPGDAAPTFTGTTSSKSCQTVSYPLSTGRTWVTGQKSWCTPTTGVGADQSTLFLVASEVISGNLENNVGQQSAARQLDFFVSVH